MFKKTAGKSGASAVAALGLGALCLPAASFGQAVQNKTPPAAVENSPSPLVQPASPVQGPPAPARVAAVVPPGIDPQLARAADLAITQYPSMAAAAALVRASEQDVRAAKWLQFPSASVSAVTRKSRINPQVNVFLPLWAGGRIDASIDRAKAVREASRAEVGVTAFDLLIRVARAYYGVVRSIRVGAILDQSLAEHQRLVESMERRVAQEVSPRSDLDLARSRAAQVRQELSTVTAQRFAALQQLRELVGDPNFEVNPLPEYDRQKHHPTSEGLVQAALTCDPGIRRLRAETLVAEADRKLSRSAIFPQVGLQVTHDRFSGTGAGVAVQAQTNGGLSPVAAANAAAARKNASEFRVTVAERETREAAILDLVENTAAEAQVESSVDAAKSSLNVTDSFMRQFITGRRTWLDVMNAVRESNAARTTLADAEVSAMSSAARLLIRSCQWQAQEIRTDSPR